MKRVVSPVRCGCHKAEEVDSWLRGDFRPGESDIDPYIAADIERTKQVLYAA